jgi:hypothetical protein
MEFPKADPVKAADTLRKITAWVGPMARSFKQTNAKASRFAAWQARQILHFIRQVSLYAGDLEVSYQSKRIDSLAQALRNLMELDVWAEYCDASEANAKRFFDDMVRDVREILDIHQKDHIQFTQKPHERADELNQSLREHAKTLAVVDLDGKFTQVRDAANELGRSLQHNGLYKIASKYAHPTALLLAQNECPQSLFDRFYEGGATLCYTCLGKLEKTILKRYPDFYVDE